MSQSAPVLSNLMPVAGIRLGVARAGIKKPDRRDLVLMELAPGAHLAAVFTRNAFCAAPITLARQHLQVAATRYLLVNTGNANAGTGPQGFNDARACCEAVAVHVGCAREEVLPFSTGVIGEPLPVARLVAGIPAAVIALADANWAEAALGIMTTDTVPKGCSVQVDIGGHRVTVTGIAKGSGMIRPDMATMLAYIATDAAVAPELLQDCLDAAVATSFNRITVDGDTSTNDACVLMATGRSAMAPISDASSAAYQILSAAVREVCEQLAQAIVRDGEGATKLITVDVQGGATVGECEAVAYAIAHSPLVKTAFFACDPNWGRILAAVGRAGLNDLAIEGIQIFLDDVCIVRDGGRAADYREERGQEVMKRSEITIRVVLGRGACAARVWTCDFSYDYVRINAEYRT